MKREFALVLETYDNNIAKVELQRGASCEGCSICSSGKPIVLRALNNINASKGDNVVIEVEELKRGTNFFVYILPLICLIVGYVIGDYFSKLISIENLGPIFSFALFFIYIIFGIMKLKKNNKIIANIICQNKIANETENDFDK
ncbi:Fis family transcriptional regulator [Brachyspira aalborgi]|uniref:Fis family transcriptional regulator n=1 Tax=Brachyspira aalborgi TaxID=29522 RepID=A0A5C8EVB0_9SPIR|nr:SoxR reducing system RseC family protein [Brachyspira aalborgi]TXJ40762.1 Fis family transcriptional regulator [Brachyspira aalborgi]TXJ53676.1 Fis family transcriptional regulator [Brachyspira aalborgi]